MFAWLRGSDGRARLLQQMPTGGVSAEIGVWQGDFSERIVQTTKPRELHLVDPWTFAPAFPGRWYGGKKAKSQSDMDEICEGVRRRFAATPCVRLHRNTSTQAAPTFADGYFDWVYIDGDHSTAAVVDDLNAWLPKVRRGGFLVGDDYTWKDEVGVLSVQVAVEAFVAQHGLDRPTIVDRQFIVRVP